MTPKTNMVNEYTCRFCADQKLEPLFPARDYMTLDLFGIYYCPRCDISYTKPELNEDTIKKYYGETYYGTRKGFTDNIINFFRLKKVTRHLNVSREEKSILDVGCGNGNFLLLFLDKKWKVKGTEIAVDSHFKSRISKYICKNRLDKCGFSNNQFDVITMWHSLEHLLDPMAYLLESYRILKNNGLIIVEVPNFGSWEARFFGDAWFHLDVPRHTHHFSAASLKLMLSRAKFTNLSVSYGPSPIYELFGITQSIINLFTKKKNLLFNLLNNKPNDSPASLDITLNILLILPAILISIVVFFIEALFKKNAIITAYGIKDGNK